MSKSKIRNDKTCLNCRHVVGEKFCPNCGQENSDIRKTFHHLFIHFFEDLTHYENAFWKTIRNLIFRPGSLTKEYLSGKRLSYLAPVRLYIFISFITFFMVTVLPDGKEEEAKQSNKNHPHINLKALAKNEEHNDSTLVLKDSVAMKKEKVKALIKSGLFSKKEKESLEKMLEPKQGEEELGLGLGYDSLEELEADYKKGKMGDSEYWFYKKVYQIESTNTQRQIIDKFNESFKHNFPKVLFIYMPLFAFFLWLFHNKKRWYYFDHGIFTLHYFSFLLLIFLIVVLFSYFVDLLGDNMLTDILKGTFDFVCYIWAVYYFFPAHHRFYGNERIISIIKGVILFFINSFFILLIMIMFVIYTFITLH